MPPAPFLFFLILSPLLGPDQTFSLQNMPNPPLFLHPHSMVGQSLAPGRRKLARLEPFELLSCKVEFCPMDGGGVVVRNLLQSRERQRIGAESWTKVARKTTRKEAEHCPPRIPSKPPATSRLSASPPL